MVSPSQEIVLHSERATDTEREREREKERERERETERERRDVIFLSQSLMTESQLNIYFFTVLVFYIYNH